MAQVIAPHALGIGHRVYLAKHLDNLASFLRELLGIDNDAAAGLLPHLYLVKLLIELDGVGNESPCVCLDEHQFEHIDLFIGYPGLVEFLQVLGHVVNDLLHCNVHIIFNDAFVNVPDN